MHLQFGCRRSSQYASSLNYCSCVTSAGKKGGNRDSGANKLPPPALGAKMKGTITRAYAWGAFLTLDDGNKAMLHVNSMNNDTGDSEPRASDLVKEGDVLEVLTPPPPSALLC